MHKLFLLLCFTLIIPLACVYAAFSHEKTTVTIYPDVEGNAHVIEKIDLRIDDENSAKIYDNNMEITNDITSWRNRTGVDAIRYHINQNVAPISNLRIIPQPKKRLSIINPSYSASLQIEYNVVGLFNKTQVKPRTYYYTLKKNALSFTYNAKNDIVLDETDYLYIMLPKEVQVVSADPIPQNVERLTPDEKELFWKGKTILQDFKVVYKYEKTLREEVEEYFSSINSGVYTFLNSMEGVYFLTMVLIIAISFIMLKNKSKNLSIS